MNTFKQQKKKFIKKHFAYPERLKFSLLSAGVVLAHYTQIDKCDINAVRYLTDTSELTKILDKHKYNVMFNWSYLYQESTEIQDWASIWWCQTGLYIHFESLQAYNLEYATDVDMTEPMWQFFYQQRKQILSLFYPELTLDYVKYEDFCIQLTNHNLIRVVKNEKGIIGAT